MLSFVSAGGQGFGNDGNGNDDDDDDDDDHRHILLLKGVEGGGEGVRGGWLPCHQDHCCYLGGS